jgi:predicted dehydrogenase
MAPGTSKQLRVGVIGAGLISQAVHLPTLRALSELYAIAGVADPSEKVRAGLGGRYPEARFYEDWRRLLEAEELDAVLVCSPHATHAGVTLAALDGGLHAFVEKPLAITTQDIDAIDRLRLEKGLVVQVGYMKRFDPGYEALLDALPDDLSALRLIDVVTYDPWMARPPFTPVDLIAGDDVSDAERAALAKLEQKQVETAVGINDPESVKAFSHVYLQALIHDVNLVHGVLEHFGVAVPVEAVTSGHWANGRAAHVVFRLPGGARWQSSWLLLERQQEFREVSKFYFSDAVYGLSFDAPYLRERPSVLEFSKGAGTGEVRRACVSRVGDAYRAELQHFHACITRGATCRTPPQQARIDSLALQVAFAARVVTN